MNQTFKKESCLLFISWNNISANVIYKKNPVLTP